MEQTVSTEQKMEQESFVSPRELRRLYKVALATSLQNEKKRENCEYVKNVPFPSYKNCLRCSLVNQGSKFLSDHITSSLTFQVPEGIHEIREEDIFDKWNQSCISIETEQHRNSESQCAAFMNMVTSVTLGAAVSRKNYINDVRPLYQIKSRSLHQGVEYLESSHLCLQPPSIRLQPKLLSLRGVEKGDESHSVIYAPPGFGKTTLQQQATVAGAALLDTDDIHCATKESLLSALKFSSVLSNRLDLVDPTQPTIAFIPANSKVLYERTTLKGLDEQDCEYFHAQLGLQGFKRIVKCYIKNSFVSQWFMGLSEGNIYPETRQGISSERKSFIDKCLTTIER